MRKHAFGQWPDVCGNVGLYWKLYGGLKTLATSPYFMVSALVSVLLFRGWLCSGVAWSDLAISVLPSVIGFALGAYTILLAFGGERFMLTISGKTNRGPSPFMRVNATFVHFIVVNFVALLFSVFVRIWESSHPIVNAVGLFFFVYALSLSLAATFAVFTLARTFDEVSPILKNDGGQDRRQDALRRE